MVEVEGVDHWQGQSGSLAIDELMASQGLVPVMRDAEFEFQDNVVYMKESELVILDDPIASYWVALSNIRFRDPRPLSGRILAKADVKARALCRPRLPDVIARRRLPGAETDTAPPKPSLGQLSTELPARAVTRCPMVATTLERGEW